MYATRAKFQKQDDSHPAVDLKGGLTPTFPRKQEHTGRVRGVTPSDQNDGFSSNRGSDPNKVPMTHTVSTKLPKWDITPGLKGIHNHGNTCFMNTILQCLSNTDVLSEYFIQRKYKDVLNSKGLKRIVGNVKGDVCAQLGCLLESLWSGNYTSEISNQLKSVVSKYNGQYKGSSQHDAQEFLLWLLDRVNEELTQTTKKKTKDVPSKGKKEKNETNTQSSSPEMVLAACSGFDVYNKFQALYQSSLTCPSCKKQSNTYEAYLCLSLPIPQKNTRPVFVTVVYLDYNPKQLKIAVEMNVMDSIKDLREKLAHELYVAPKRLVLAQICDDGFRNTFGDEQPLTDIHESENIYVFETFPFAEINKTPDSDMIQILLVHVEKVTESKKSFRFCSPEVIKVLRDLDFPSLQKCILKSMNTLAVSDAKIENCQRYSSAIFDIRVIDSGPSDCYLPTEVDMPLYTEAIDRALSTYNEEYGPAHVKFVVEWDPEMKKRFVDNDEDIYEEHQSVHKARLGQQQVLHVSLDDCLRLFTKEEKLGEGDAWHCPGCRKVQDGATKKLGLWSAPDLLVIHLKRFRHSGLKRNKVNILVNFPVSDLDLGPHLLPSNNSNHGSISDMYDLYAVSNHYGNLSGGHYTAFCRNPVDMNWYEFDDTYVKPISHRDIVTRAAYLLFYQRRKLTNNALDSLMLKTHWVFDVMGPSKAEPRLNSPVSEGRKASERSSENDKNNRKEFDINDFYVSKVNLTDIDSQDTNVGSSRNKADIYVERRVSDEEAALLEELRRDKSPPHSEHDDWVSSSFGEMAKWREINSPRREEIGINSPRQTVRKEFKGSTQKDAVSNNHLNTVSRKGDSDTGYRHKMSVAEKIIKSRQTIDGVDKSKERYRRSDSVDSSKNSQSLTSGSDSSSPPSPQDISAQSNAKRQGNIMNNERDLAIINGNLSNNVKLKIHSNEINKSSTGSKSTRSVPVKAFDMYDGKLNQKVNNTEQQNTSKDPPPVPLRRDLHGTPQQPRKSPSPPAWSTPQPQRKQYAEPTPYTERQFSVPPRNSKPGSKTSDEKKLKIEGHTILDSQPKSLPSETRSVADKPPLPSKPTPSPRGTSGVSKSQEYSSSYGRPRTAQGSSRGQTASNGRPVSAHEPRSQQPGTGSHTSRSAESRRSQTRSEVRMRNRSVDRNQDFRRSERGRSERPVSYHHPTQNDFSDEYYLSQPVNDYDDQLNFERTSRYATFRQPRTDNYGGHVSSHNDFLVSNDIQCLASQLPERMYTGKVSQQQPRSRAPISYSPHLYQDRSYELPRYQPHLHVARALTRLAIKEKQKRSAQYLKESSV